MQIYFIYYLYILLFTLLYTFTHNIYRMKINNRNKEIRYIERVSKTER